MPYHYYTPPLTGPTPPPTPDRTHTPWQGGSVLPSDDNTDQSQQRGLLDCRKLPGVTDHWSTFSPHVLLAGKHAQITATRTHLRAGDSFNFSSWLHRSIGAKTWRQRVGFCWASGVPLEWPECAYAAALVQNSTKHFHKLHLNARYTIFVPHNLGVCFKS